MEYMAEKPHHRTTINAIDGCVMNKAINASIALCLALFQSEVGAQSQDSTDLIPLRCDIPGDFFSPAKGNERTLDRLQHDFDIYSWETFIAINWPTISNGEPDKSLVIGSASNGDNHTCWEEWKSVLEVFLKDGAKPPEWDQESSLSAMLPIGKFEADKIDPNKDVLTADGKKSAGMTVNQAFNNPDYRFVNKIGKMHSWFANEQSLDSGPLVDRNGRYLRYEILINKDAFEYVVRNRLYSIQGQQDYIDTNRHFVFPSGSFKLADESKPFSDFEYDASVNNRRPVTKSDGAIILKAAWKELSEKEASSGRFHTRKTVVYTPMDSKNNTQEQSFRLVSLGLVGLHIVHKSSDVAQWNWSTFEHVDNCPDFSDRDRQFDGAGKRIEYSFFDPGSFHALGQLERERKLNIPPERPWTPDKIESELSRRTQVVRMTPKTPDVISLNEKFHAKFREVNVNSVWQYYDLVSTQWPTRPAGFGKPHGDKDGDVLKHSPADILGGPAPVFLANTVMETYIQGRTPNTSSSCMECHANALSKSGHFSDFTFILDRAK